MIKIEIIESLYPEQDGIYTFYKNHLLLGTSALCDILLRSEDSFKEHLFIELRDQMLTVFKDKKCEQIHINGKIVTRSKKIKKNDTIKVSALSLRIIDFKEEAEDTKTSAQIKEDIKNKYPHLNDFLNYLESKNEKSL